MRRIRIVHTADLHLDSPFEGLSAAQASIRRGEQRALLGAIADVCASESADLLLMSGDLLDSWNTFYETGEELARCLGSVSCPVFISPGNHDFYSPRSPWARLKLPDHVTVFRENAVRFTAVPEAGARVYGAAFTDSRCGPLLKGFHAERKNGIYNILCMHAEVGNPNSAYNPVSTEELADSGLDYAAFGHVHSASGLRQAGGTHYSWPGCPEGRGFDECGEKTVSVVELEGGECELRTVSVAQRRYQKLAVDISDGDPLLLIHTALPDDTVRDVYRITLTGETEIPPDLRRLHQNLDEMFFSLQLRDETGVRQSVWERAGEDSLRGIFLARLRERWDEAADDAQRARIEQAARWGLAALDNAEEVRVHEAP
ncbi:MAG: DNA repair exonuclease [Oscillospiraceae bacterium]|nr:DNA repair exonuclease [Oscillospiraceae bacterium]